MLDFFPEQGHGPVPPNCQRGFPLRYGSFITIPFFQHYPRLRQNQTGIRGIGFVCKNPVPVGNQIACLFHLAADQKTCQQNRQHWKPKEFLPFSFKSPHIFLPFFCCKDMVGDFPAQIPSIPGVFPGGVDFFKELC